MCSSESTIKDIHDFQTIVQTAYADSTTIHVIEELKQDITTRGGWTIDTQSYSTGFTFFNRVTKVRTYRPNHVLVNWYCNRKSLNHKYIYNALRSLYGQNSTTYTTQGNRVRSRQR